MEAIQESDGSWMVHLGPDEGVVLYEVIARSEWAEDLGVVTVDHRAEQVVLSRLMLALQSGVPNIGSDHDGDEVQRARDSVAGAD